MPGDPTKKPVDFPTWLAWRLRQPYPQATTRGILDEIHKLAVFGIAEITEEIVAVWLHDEPGSIIRAVVPVSEVIDCELYLVPPERILAEPEIILAPPALLPPPPRLRPLGLSLGPPTFEAAVHRGLHFRVADAARFGEYITGLTPPAPIPDKPQRVSKEQLLSWLKENYAERPVEKDFISAATRHFKHPYWDVTRAAAREALRSKEAADFFNGPTTKRLRRPLS